MKNEKPAIFSLRQATENDLLFLFKVSTDAMKPVVEALSPDKEFDNESELAAYKDKFNPEKVEVVQFEGKDVGRLRVVRSSESIYIGGVQILPAFQGNGIGGAIFKKLIEESKTTNIPIALEVHDVNKQAINFYIKLGFVSGEKVGNKIVMRYMPNA